MKDFLPQDDESTTQDDENREVERQPRNESEEDCSNDTIILENSIQLTSSEERKYECEREYKVCVVQLELLLPPKRLYLLELPNALSALDIVSKIIPSHLFNGSKQGATSLLRMMDVAGNPCGISVNTCG